MSSSLENNQPQKSPNSLEEVNSITGTELAYYFVCARKLWFFAHHIECEHDNDAVRHGRHIHETSYKREKKEVAIDGVIVMDWIDHDQKIIHEVKKSSSMEEAHRWQLKYYMWYMEGKGMKMASPEAARQFPNQPKRRGYIGELNYPQMRTTKQVVLTDDDREEITEKIIPNIRKITGRSTPPKTVEWDVCKYCSYNELCYS